VYTNSTELQRTFTGSRKIGGIFGGTFRKMKSGTPKYQVCKN
jgi:hypothetical protein